MTRVCCQQAQPIKGVLAMRNEHLSEVARAIGKSRVHMSRIVNGHINPSPKIRRAVSEHLGVPEAELFRPRSARTP